MALGAGISIDIFNISGTINIVALPVFLVIFFYKIKSYSFIKSLAMIFLPIFIIVVIDLFVMTVSNFFFPTYLASFPLFPLLAGFTFKQFLQFMPYIALTCGLSFFATFLLVKVTKNQRKLIIQSNRVWKALAILSSFVIIAIAVALRAVYHFEASLDYLVWNTISLLGIATATLVSVVFYARSLQERTALQQKEAEQTILQDYLRQTERQLTGMRKFKHDYQNILLPLNAFIKEKDWVGLEQYMPQVNAASTIITKDDFALENLSNINVPEIKILLAAKLMLAQNINMHIQTTFEAHEDINHIPIDSIALVRMLGIILDNAIEELVTLGAGHLMVACYKSGNGVTFVVQNTCRTEINPLYELEQAGFSSKGDGRGLGLSNLAELIATYSDNLSLQTNIKNGTFEQKLWIAGKCN